MIISREIIVKTRDEQTDMDRDFSASVCMLLDTLEMA